MIQKSKETLTNWLSAVAPDMAQITVETEPDQTKGSGLALYLETASITPTTGHLAMGTATWRIVYAPGESGTNEEAHSLFDTLIEAMFEKPVLRHTSKVPFKLADMQVQKEEQQLEIRITMRTELQKSEVTYDLIQDIQLTTGG